MSKQRVKLVVEEKSPSNPYQLEDPRASAIERIPSGCRLFDLALGGGWAKNRIVNIVGDESTGKTHLAIELAANFALKYGPTIQIRYRDAEEAFDVPYARNMGLPEESIDFGDGEEFETVQDFSRCLEKFVKELPKGTPGLYILDSLDSLSEDDELEGPKLDQDGKEKGSYGTGKAKAMSRLFRRLVRQMGKKDVTLIIISQTRDAIGVMFGEKKTRTGGKALNFYSSQTVWLAQIGKVHKTRGGIERTIGVNIRARVKKNKTGDPFHEVDYPIYFKYGIDDVRAGLSFLAASKRMDALGLDDLNAKEQAEEPRKRGIKKKAGNAALTRFMDKLDVMPPDEYRTFRKRVNKAVVQVWRDHEKAFNPIRRKYE